MKQNSEFDYQSEIVIDENALDAEWKQQPALALKYNEAKADAQRELDQAKEALDIITAEKDLEIRNTAEKKPTEAQIASTLSLDPDIQEKRQGVIDAKYRLNLLQAACLAFDQRKTALENLVKLFGMNYYAEPTADIENRGRLDAMVAKEAVAKVKLTPPKRSK